MSSLSRVLVFGKNGQLGSQILKLLSTAGVDTLSVDVADVDLTKTVEISDFIQDARPGWVVNCAAHTAVDRAESEEELSWLLNAAAPEAMATTCARLGSRLIHYSTDYVFDGNATQPYSETDPVNPQSVYGKTKLAGEQAVLNNLPDAIIFRTAWVYAKAGNNFVNTMLRLASERDEINVVQDQTGCPTLADELAKVSVNIMNKVESGEYCHVGGIFHATGGGETSWYEFCRAIMAYSGIHTVTINPITTDQYPTPAPRPAYSVLSNRRLEEVYGESLPNWKVSLRNFLEKE